MKTRKYKSGSAWALWRWTEVNSEYIVRLHVVKTPWFSICLHWILKPDPEPDMHDHPVTFLSLILKGGYTEARIRGDGPLGDGDGRLETHRFFNFIRASPDDIHKIVSVKSNTLTLCLMGPKTREWGFHTPTGWVYWKDYYK